MRSSGLRNDERPCHGVGRRSTAEVGRWGEIDVGKKKLKVDDVEPGAEADLRHFLETAVLQANADPPPNEKEGERSDADQAMTDAFRSFAD